MPQSRPETHEKSAGNKTRESGVLRVGASLAYEAGLGVRDRRTFDELLLPHLDAAYTLARYLLRDQHEAEDAVQDAFLRAVRYFGSFHGGDARAWLLTIVRNSCATRRRREHIRDRSTEFNDEVHSPVDDASDAEAKVIRAAEAGTIRRAIDELPFEFREVVVLRDVQGLSYREIAEVAEIPMGTVMSRLARARARVRERLSAAKGDRVT